MDFLVEKLLSALLPSPDWLPDVKAYLQKHFQSSQIQSPEALRWLLSITNRTGWQYFIKILENPLQVKEKDIALGEYRILTDTGAAQLTKVSVMGKTSFNLTLPDQIRTFLCELDFDSIKRDKLRRLLVHQYASAAVNVYGMIEKEQFLRMFNTYIAEPPETAEQTGEEIRVPLSSGELQAVLEPYSEASVDVLLAGDRLIHAMIGLSNTGRYAGYGPGQYCPFKKSEFLKYADQSYYKETRQVKIFKDTLLEKIPNIDQEYLETICHVFAPCYLAEWEEIIEAGLMELPEVRSKTNRRLFAELFVKAKNSLPNWFYKGWTEDEFAETGDLDPNRIENDILKFMKID